MGDCDGFAATTFGLYLCAFLGEAGSIFPTFMSSMMPLVVSSSRPPKVLLGCDSVHDVESHNTKPFSQAICNSDASRPTPPPNPPFRQ